MYRRSLLRCTPSAPVSIILWLHGAMRPDQTTNMRQIFVDMERADHGN